MGYFVYLWFANKEWFFKTNNNESQDKKPEWLDMWMFSGIFKWYVRLLLSFVFIFIFPLFIIIPIICYHIVLFSTMSYKAFLNDERISFSKIIVETLKYYKVTIVSLIIVSIILLAFSKLGVIFGVTFIVTVLLVYTGFIPIDILKDLSKPIPEKNLSPLVSYDMADKKCIEEHTETKLGLFRRAFNFLTGQKGGGNITKDLKKLSKNVHK
jgi:hypothetical protein